MVDIVGIGNTGKKIVEKLLEFKNYKGISIDSPGDIPVYKTPEQYEEKCPSFKKKFKDIKGETYVFLSASGIISGAALRILEQIRSDNLNVVCIHSDPVTLSSMGSLQQNLVSNVLQQYARSGLIKKLYMIHNDNVEEMIGDVSLEEYWDEMNKTIASVFHTIMYFKNTEPVMSSGKVESVISNICTFGIMKKDKEKLLLHPLRNVMNEEYFFTFKKGSKQKKLLKEIKGFCAEAEEPLKRTFSIFQGDEEETVYFIASTHIPEMKEQEQTP